MNLPFPDDHFDFAIADGAPHHTPDRTGGDVRRCTPRAPPAGRAVLLLRVQEDGGRPAVLRRPRPRAVHGKLDPEACYAACEPITETGRELSKLKAKITLTKPIPVLGMPGRRARRPAGCCITNFVKCFWNDAFNYETNNMVNFDWYHPHNA